MLPENSVSFVTITKALQFEAITANVNIQGWASERKILQLRSILLNLIFVEVTPFRYAIQY